MICKRLEPVAVIAMAVLCVAVPTPSLAQTIAASLSGGQEVPPNASTGSGSGVITLAADKTISGSVTTVGVEGSMAHVHEGKMPNGNGPAIISLIRTAENVWSIPADTKLTGVQIQSLKSGNLYINVHSATYKAGEIRGQLK